MNSIFGKIGSTNRLGKPSLGKVMAVGGMLIAGSLSASSCLLGNVHNDECTTDTQCSTAFGLGSTCSQGYCTDAATCKTSSDCRKFGYMTNCTSGACVPTKLDKRCLITGDDAITQSIAADGGTGDGVLMGALFNLSQGKEVARGAAAQVAIDQIVGQMGTRPFGLIACDTTPNADGTSPVVELGTYLATEVGVPVIIGPSSSQSATDLATAFYDGDTKIPTAIISHAATAVQLTKQADRIKSTDKQGLLWRTAVSDGIQAVVLSGIISDANPGNPNIGLLYIDENYGTSFQLGLTQQFGDSKIHSYGFNAISGGTKLISNAVSGLASDNDGGFSLGAVVVVSNRVDFAVEVLKDAAGTSLGALPFYLTDGSKDPTIAQSGDAGVNMILKKARGTAPAVTGDNIFYGLVFDKIHTDPKQFSFVANAYDATYVAAYGVIFAEQKSSFTGEDVAQGFGQLSSGTALKLGSTTQTAGISTLKSDGKINLQGESGNIDFDANGDVLGGTSDFAVWCVGPSMNILNGSTDCP